MIQVTKSALIFVERSGFPYSVVLFPYIKFPKHLGTHLSGISKCGPHLKGRWAKGDSKAHRGGSSFTNKGASLRNWVGLVATTRVRLYDWLPGRPVVTRQVHRVKAWDQTSSQACRSGVRPERHKARDSCNTARARAESPSLNAATKQRQGAPSNTSHSTFSHSLFLLGTHPGCHSCSVSELALTFLEDNGKQLSSPLACLQPQHTVP